VAKSYKFLGKGMTGFVVRVKPVDAQTVLLGKLRGKHQLGKPGRDG